MALLMETTSPAGLAEFAFGWLKMWTEKGGWAEIAYDGRLSIYQPEFELSPDQRRCLEMLEDEEPFHRRERLQWWRTFYDGNMRALGDILNAVDGGREAVREIVAASPNLGRAQAYQEPLAPRHSAG